MNKIWSKYTPKHIIWHQFLIKLFGGGGGVSEKSDPIIDQKRTNKLHKFLVGSMPPPPQIL